MGRWNCRALIGELKQHEQRDSIPTAIFSFNEHKVTRRRNINSAILCERLGHENRSGPSHFVVKKAAQQGH
jgi:hypothetical protein